MVGTKIREPPRPAEADNVNENAVSNRAIMIKLYTSQLQEEAKVFSFSNLATSEQSRTSGVQELRDCVEISYFFFGI